MLKSFILAGIGGGMGAMLRFGISLLMRTGYLPYPTLLVNVLGSFIMGIILALGMQQLISEQNRIFLATGLCGGFTTFSAFSVENLQMVHEGKYLQAFLYVLLSVLFGILATWAGYKWFS